ncbi:ketoacyl-ACP synthase III [Candidatus Desantisbacteria bacterium]|nr:ketoacyl-ACP synthase III [Candidatus Desantisbacteria bacterium]
MKKIRSVGIVGTGSYVPPKILTNSDLEKMVDTSDTWIVERTGIRERRISSPETTASCLGLPASITALKSAGVSPEDVDLIIVATSTPDMTFPSTACFIQNKIGASRAACFDLSAACTGFSYALEVGQQFIATSTYKTALIVGAEVISKVIDWTDRNTCILFGDGAGAAVLQPVKDDYGILSTSLGADGRLASVLDLPVAGCIRMSGREVFKVAVNTMIEAVEKVLDSAEISQEDVSLLIPHQANIRIIEAMGKRLNIPQEKVFVNVQKYGNVSAGSTIIALDEAVKQGRVGDGDIIVIVAFGGGLTWGATVMRWGGYFR